MQVTYGLWSAIVTLQGVHKYSRPFFGVGTYNPTISAGGEKWSAT